MDNPAWIRQEKWDNLTAPCWAQQRLAPGWAWVAECSPDGPPSRKQQPGKCRCFRDACLTDWSLFVIWAVTHQSSIGCYISCWLTTASVEQNGGRAAWSGRGLCDGGWGSTLFSFMDSMSPALPCLNTGREWRRLLFKGCVNQEKEINHGKAGNRAGQNEAGCLPGLDIWDSALWNVGSSSPVLSLTWVIDVPLSPTPITNRRLSTALGPSLLGRDVRSVPWD